MLRKTLINLLLVTLSFSAIQSFAKVSNETSKTSVQKRALKINAKATSRANVAKSIRESGKKPERRAKSPRQVRTSVISRSGSVDSASSHLSFGAALGLARSRDHLNLKSSVSIVVDQKTQEVLFEKNPTAVLPIASISKLMTAMVVLDAKQSLDDSIVINDEDVHIYNHSRLVLGTELTRREAFLLALMSSENRAAYTLARNYPGGLAAFIPAMNRKAQELGMVNTKFADPTGLTNQNVSTAEDLVRMVNAAYQYPLIREFSTHASYTKVIRGRPQEFISSNRLVRSGDMEIGLQKTGYIADAGRCLVMQATVKGRAVIMVFLDSAGKLSRFADAVRVKEWVEDGSEVHTIRRLSFDKSAGNAG